jgi:hypothetical protein|uniref:hypothetical protein n=1 Tax=Alloprevotella sp. TaxID=1872471 RepID=UPI003FEF1E6F
MTKKESRIFAHKSIYKLSVMPLQRKKGTSNPFAFKAKSAGKKKSTGKRVGKSKREKANNQLNRRVK